MTTLSPPPGFGGLLQQIESDVPKRSKDRRVTWAIGDKLCQVRLFVAEDAPVMSGAIQEQLQAKQARFMHIFQTSVTSVSPEDAPPGFGGVAVKPKADPAALALIVAQIPWRRPDMYAPDPAWQVQAGDNSLEKDLQKEREFRVLEAVYPRPSSIPESPAEPSEVQEAYDDEKTPQIPLVPLEDEDMPDVADGSTPGPRFFNQSATRQQVAGSLMPLSKSGNQLLSTNILMEGLKPYTRDGLVGFIQENAQGRKESSWRDGGAPVFRGRNPSVDHVPDVFSSRPSSTSVLPDNPATSNQTGAEPDVAAAAAAAYAALSKSKEVGSMIDNNLLIQLLKDPSLMQALTNKQTFPLPNSQSEFSSNLAVGGPSRVPENVNQTQNGSSVALGSHWPTVSSVFPSTVAGGQDGAQTRIGDGFVQGSDRFQRKSGTDDRSQLFMAVPLNGGPMFSEMMSGGRVGTTAASRPGNTGAGPPGFGSGSAPPGFGSNPSAVHGSQLATSHTTATGSARPLSRHDEQYFKDLIMQHGCKSADDDDHGRAGFEGQGNISAARSRGGAETPALRWFGGMTEEEDSGRFDRSRRESDRLSTSVDPQQTRSKSRKTCIYYGTSRGCRNGSSCTFVHELSSERLRVEKVRSEPSQMQFVKRLKVDG
ncbi:hypothetical protein Mapa_012136 [Marchantia paleacea]|nr:hypothetical protein Mapa_012136 [Marchantia paleacea]